MIFWSSGSARKKIFSGVIMSSEFIFNKILLSKLWKSSSKIWRESGIESPWRQIKFFFFAFWEDFKDWQCQKYLLELYLRIYLPSNDDFYSKNKLKSKKISFKHAIKFKCNDKLKTLSSLSNMLYTPQRKYPSFKWFH